MKFSQEKLDRIKAVNNSLNEIVVPKPVEPKITPDKVIVPNQSMMLNQNEPVQDFTAIVDIPSFPDHPIEVKPSIIDSLPALKEKIANLVIRKK